MKRDGWGCEKRWIHYPSSMRKPHIARLITASLIGSMAPTANGLEVTLSPSQDSSIFQELPDNSSGAGLFIFAGATAQSNIRRGLIQFDIQSLPKGAVITSAGLTLTVAKAPASSDTATTQTLHRATAD